MNSLLVTQLRNNLPQSLFKTSGVDTSDLPVFAEVVGLNQFDLSGIYHHLHTGVVLALRYNHAAESGQNVVELFYQNFKIGELDNVQDRVVAEMLLHGFDLKVVITQTEKVKYLPHHRIQVAISDNQL